MQNYPSIKGDDPESQVIVLREIVRLREIDVSEFDNLPNIFIKGRKVNKVPTASNDITDSLIGDFNYSATYLYICVDNSGAAWRRVAISSF